MHDTVGICYQNVDPERQLQVSDKAEANIKVTGPPKEPGRNRKPAFQPIQTTLEPYRKKAKITLFNYENHTHSPDQRESLS